VRRALLTLMIGSLATACGRCAGEPSPEPDDARACASACAALVGAGCGDAASCTSACLERNRALAPAGCEAERRAYLGCVSTASIDCDAVPEPAHAFIERHQGITGCDAEHAAHRACVAPCEQSGVRHVASRTLGVAGRERRIGAETTHAGCAECPALGSGAPPGSACQSPKVCAERCCECGDHRVRFTARVCADGSCAGDDACELARQIEPGPCSKTSPK
jgi:hypothetical protein